MDGSGSWDDDDDIVVSWCSKTNKTKNGVNTSRFRLEFGIENSRLTRKPEEVKNSTLVLRDNHDSGFDDSAHE